MKRTLALILFLALCATPALAGKYDLELPSNLANGVFKDVVKEAGVLTAYRGVAPAEPEGITGFDIGVEASFIKVDGEVWDQILEGNAPSYLAVPKIHVRKGLPFGIDLGASYAMVPASNIKLIGGEVQYAFLDGSTLMPALALRGHYSTMLGVEDLDLNTYGADLVVSKGFLIFTPYAGVGLMKINGSYAGNNATLKTTLKDQSATETRAFVGLQTSIALLRLTVDAEFGDVPVYTAKASIGW